jgi:hypothetical protein
MSVGVQASLMRGVQSSPSTALGSRPSWPTTKKRTKHKDDLANAKLIPSLLPDYIPPLAGAVSHDNVPRYFEYAMVTVYLPKGIPIVRVQQEKIAMLKFSEFNLRDHMNHSVLAPFR